METTAIATPQVFTHEDFGTVRIRELDNHMLEINLEDAARGLGFTRIANSGNQVIRWERVKQYLAEVGACPEVGTDAYIPEQVFYMLAMKATNAAAKKFQRWVAFEVIPQIRMHGYYAMPTATITPKDILDPDFIINLAQALKAERAKSAKLEEKVGAQAAKIDEMTPKASFYDLLNSCKDPVTVTTIGKDYKMGARKFNQLLQKLGVQFNQRGRWVLKQEFSDKFETGEALTATCQYPFVGKDGKSHTNEYMVWTQAGRYQLVRFLAEKGIYPKVAKPNVETSAPVSAEKEPVENQTELQF